MRRTIATGAGQVSYLNIILTINAILLLGLVLQNAGLATGSVYAPGAASERRAVPVRIEEVVGGLPVSIVKSEVPNR